MRAHNAEGQRDPAPPRATAGKTVGGSWATQHSARTVLFSAAANLGNSRHCTRHGANSSLRQVLPWQLSAHTGAHGSTGKQCRLAGGRGYNLAVLRPTGAKLGGSGSHAHAPRRAAPHSQRQSRCSAARGHSTGACLTGGKRFAQRRGTSARTAKPNRGSAQHHNRAKTASGAEP
jgi:hypothetical protein